LTVATDLFDKSRWVMLEALINGAGDPEVLADLALGKMLEALGSARGAHRSF
jgi:hypothetical protein